MICEICDIYIEGEMHVCIECEVLMCYDCANINDVGIAMCDECFEMGEENEQE